MVDRVGHVFGSYRLVRLLGVGGFAEVYLGEHLYLGTQAAIKLLSAQLEDERVEAFRAEALTIARLEHPHIVRVLDFGVEQGTPFLVMQYAPNGSLRRHYPPGRLLAPADILPYLQQAADALDYAHDLRVIHRDVKPDNMLLGLHQELLFSDFGIATIAHSSRSQRAQEVVGTALYMAPEQFQGHPRPASDQYSLAVVVYEWLAGVAPFQGSFAEVSGQHLYAPPPLLRERLPGVAPALEQVVLRALAKDPAQRFGTVQAFARAFAQASQCACSVFPAAGLPAPAPLAPLAPTERALPPLAMAGRPGEETSSVLPGVLPIPPPTLLPQPPPKRGTSRRAFLIGGAAGVAAAGLAIGGGFTVLRELQALHPSGAAHSPFSAYTYTGHTASVNAVAWSPDNRRIASTSDDMTVQIWNALTGAHPVILRGHTNAVYAVAWSPDGRYLASGGADKSVRVWDVAAAKLLFIYSGHTGRVTSVAWSPNGKYIASGSSDESVQVWHPADRGKNAQRYDTSLLAPRSLAWSPDGKFLAAGGTGNTASVFDGSGHNVDNLRAGSTLSTLMSLSWSLDSKRLADGGDDALVWVWDVKAAQRDFTFNGHSSTVTGVSWAPDDDYIVSSSLDKTVQVWNPPPGSGNSYTSLYIYRGHSDAALAVAWSHVGKYIASGSADTTVQVWRPE